jgi:hypothetical protein
MWRLCACIVVVLLLVGHSFGLALTILETFERTSTMLVNNKAIQSKIMALDDRVVALQSEKLLLMLSSKRLKRD